MTSIMAVEARYRETFAGSPLEARRARKAIAAFASGWLHGLDATDFESAVGEALANAVEHGRCSRLVVDCCYARKKVTVDIRQDGVGFQPPMNSHPPAEGSARGYGLFIMRAVLDELKFHDQGTRVRLVKATA